MAKSKRSANVVNMPGAYSPQNAGGQTAPSVDHDAIARRAYEIYESRGRVAGGEMDDWLQAERELKAMATKAS